MNEMQRWLANYERRRHLQKEPSEFWASSKYDIQGTHWEDMQQTFIPELRMNFGQACSALKKSWKAYKIAGRNGEPRGDIAWRIRSIESALGIEKSEFPELEGMDDEEMTDKEIQLKREEIEAEAENWWGLEEYTEGWSEEDKQLKREEQQELIEELRNEESAK